MSQLSSRLREYRKSKRLRLKVIAEASGISVSYLSDIERGRVNPSLETLQALADFYRMSLSGLLSGVRVEKL